MPITSVSSPCYIGQALSVNAATQSCYPASAGSTGAYASGLSRNDPTSYSLQTINGPPPCPINVKEREWDALLEELPANLTLQIWCDAVSSGFSKTPMGQNTGWMWHDILIEKSDLSNLSEDDHARLCQMLEALWGESINSIGFPTFQEQAVETTEYILQEAADNHALLRRLPRNNPLTILIAKRFDADDGHRWAAQQRTTMLVNQLVEALPFLSVPAKYYESSTLQGNPISILETTGIYKKIEHFLWNFDQKTRENHPEYWSTRITEPVFEQIKEHWFEHMKTVNQRNPDADAAVMIKSWDEISASLTIQPCPTVDDMLSGFCVCSEHADYG